MRKESADKSIGDILFFFIICIVAMPIAGIYLLAKSEDKKGLGAVLLVIGLLFWIYIALNH